MERFAGGFRNAYDFAFTSHGELFTYDADMEWDIGAPWYRPTRVNHVPSGAEFGWRSGWAKWPEYYVDSLPAILDLGGGSPTGVEVYEHVVFPAKYQGALFVGDWARGQISAVFPTPHGASYTAESETFVVGTPLNVADLAVGPDGALYFCTGGRGTEGGLYRVRYTGDVPAESLRLGQGIERALKHPQLDAPWAQAQVAAAKQQAGRAWGEQLRQIAGDARQLVNRRVRALALLQLYGPRPDAATLVRLSHDGAAAIRANATRLLGTVAAKRDAADAVTARLTELLQDPAPQVRRLAAESIVRAQRRVPVNSLLRLMQDDDRFVRFAARRALERQPVAEWREAVLRARNPHVFAGGATALLTVAPTADTARAVLERTNVLLRGTGRGASQAETADVVLDLLRVAQLALIRGEVQTAAPAAGVDQKLTELRGTLLERYPAEDHRINRELVRLLARLQEPALAERMVAQIRDEAVPPLEKLHIGAYAPRLKVGWTTPLKIALIEYYDAARSLEGGYSVSAYIENFARDFFDGFSLEEKRQVISAGADWPTSALSVLAKLPPRIPAQVLTEIRELDRRLTGRTGDAIARLRVGITATLARSGDPESLAYLRQVYEQQPSRRPVVAMALTQQPGGENWPVLVDSLKIVEGPVAEEVLTALARVDRTPIEPGAYRSAILLGLKSNESVARAAAALLARWTETASPTRSVARYARWYAERFPNAPPAELPKSARSKWSYDELLSYLQSDNGQAGDVLRGATIFRQAQCATCHRFDGEGDTIGPDLTTVAQRFHKKEILESIVYPSHVISDQYASQSIEVLGRTLTGMVVPSDDEQTVVLLMSDGSQRRIPRGDIDEISASRLSVMPENLLNPLTLGQVADLFAYLQSQPRTASQQRQTTGR